MASWTGVSLHIFSSFIHKALCLCTRVASPTSSTSSKQATSLSDGCSYWSSGDTTGWDIMCQSDSNMCIYTLCLTTTQPKSFFIYLRQKPSPGDPLLFCFRLAFCGVAALLRSSLRQIWVKLWQTLGVMHVCGPWRKGSPVTSSDSSLEWKAPSFCLSTFLV